MSLTVVTTTYNSSAYLDRTLTSVRWADEIVVVDSTSSDATVEVARKYTSCVFTRPNNPMLNSNKNFGFEKAKSDWILCLDSDEVITKELAGEITSVITKESDISGYWIPRKNIIFGKWIRNGLWWPDEQLRLFRRKKGKFPCKHVHEYLHVDGKTARLKNPYTHYNYESIGQYLEKMMTIYTPNEVERLLASGYTPVWQDALRFPVSDFLKIYFAQKGYRDGLHGLTLAILQSVYSFLVFAKAWEQRGFSERDISLREVSSELAAQKKDISYWCDTAKIGQADTVRSRLWHRIKRKVSRMV